MAPQLLITLVLFSIAFIFKLALIVFSAWYEDSQYAYGNVQSELFMLSIAIVVNLLAMYGLDCSIKGGCVVYVYIVTGIIVWAFLMDMYHQIRYYKYFMRWARRCTLAGGKVDFNNRLCIKNIS
jgi:hypothetical protein